MDYKLLKHLKKYHQHDINLRTLIDKYEYSKKIYHQTKINLLKYIQHNDPGKKLLEDLIKTCKLKYSIYALSKIKLENVPKTKNTSMIVKQWLFYLRNKNIVDENNEIRVYGDFINEFEPVFQIDIIKKIRDIIDNSKNKKIKYYLEEINNDFKYWCFHLETNNKLKKHFNIYDNGTVKKLLDLFK